MKKLLFLTAVLVANLANAQFDRILVSPISKYPSLAGNEGKKRIFFGKNETSSTFKLVSSFDFFSKKLKGAYGISLENMQETYNLIKPYNSLKGTVVYSPKLTFKKKEQTWAPAIGLKYNIFYSNQNNSFSYNPYPKNPEKNLILSPYLGIAANTKKTLYAYSFIADRMYKTLESNFLSSYKIDKNSENKISSTISAEASFDYMYKSQISEYTFPDYFRIQKFRITASLMYDLKLSKFYLGQSIQLSNKEYLYFDYFDSISAMKEKISFSSRIGYKGNKFNFFFGLKYGKNYNSFYRNSKNITIKGLFGTSFSF